MKTQPFSEWPNAKNIMVDGRPLNEFKGMPKRLISVTGRPITMGLAERLGREGYRLPKIIEGGHGVLKGLIVWSPDVIEEFF